MGKENFAHKQNIIIIVMTIMLVFALALGITVAWFTDMASIQGDITLGSLNIRFQYYQGGVWKDSDQQFTTGAKITPGATILEKMRLIEGTKGINIPFYLRLKIEMTDEYNILADVDMSPAASGWTNEGKYYYRANGNNMIEMSAASLGGGGFEFFTNGLVIPGTVGNEAMGKTCTLSITAEVIQSKNIGNTIADVKSILGEDLEEVSINLNGGIASATPLATIRGTGDNIGKFIINGGTPNAPTSRPNAEFYFFSDIATTSNATYFANMANMTRYDLGVWYDIPDDNQNFYATYLEPTTWLNANGKYDHGSQTGDIIIANGPTSISGITEFNSAEFYDYIEDFFEIPWGRSDFNSITLPYSVQIIGGGAFYRSNISFISMSDNVNTIAGAAFMYCENLTTIKLPKNLQTIGSFVGVDLWGAFIDCGLVEIVIPASVRVLGGMAFVGCSNLENIYFCHNEEDFIDLYMNGSFGPMVFYFIKDGATFYFKSEMALDFFINAGEDAIYQSGKGITAQMWE